VGKYDAAIRYVDTELGRLFDRLRQRGIYDDTLILLTSDHGEEFWEHQGTGHGYTLYEEQLRVPLIVKPTSGARVRIGKSSWPAAVIDVVPTILDYLRLPIPPFVEGLSVKPLIRGKTRPANRVLFAEDTFFFNSYAVIDHDLKYIANRVPPADLLNLGLLLANVRSFYKFRENELYRLEADPREQQNHQEAEPEAVARLRRRLRDHVSVRSSRSQIAIDEATSERLRALGYGR
jgi:arylsulfatase A-like enzyme